MAQENVECQRKTNFKGNEDDHEHEYVVTHLLDIYIYTYRVHFKADEIGLIVTLQVDEY